MNNANSLISIVVPLYNEQDNVDRLVDDVSRALSGVTEFELVLVDDRSSDETWDRVRNAAANHVFVKPVRHSKNAGQSAATISGVMAARGAWIVTMDGDLQNDPSDIPKLLGLRDEQVTDKPFFIAGKRAKRRDSWIKRVSSRIANHVRSRLLNDQCLDTGCSLKLFRRDHFLMLPQFDHLHRFLPAMFAREGIRIINVPVNHRARHAGQSKYGLGNRLWVGIVDLLGTRWLMRRSIGIPIAERNSFLHQGESNIHE